MSFRFLESWVPTAFPRRTGNDKASGSAGLWLGSGLIPRVRIIDTVVQVEVIAVIGSTKGERKGRRGQVLENVSVSGQDKEAAKELETER